MQVLHVRAPGRILTGSRHDVVPRFRFHRRTAAPMHPFRIHRLALAVPVIALLAACSDSTEPRADPDPLVVSASLIGGTGPIIVDATPQARTLVRCLVQVRLTATG